MLKQTIKSALLTSVITAVIFGIITFSYVDNYMTTYTYVSVEVNPSIAFELNKHNTVIKALPMNEDAEELDLASMEGEPFVNAIEVFVNQSDEHEFIKNDAIMYMTAVRLKDDTVSFDELKTSIFDSGELKRASKHIKIGFAASSVEKLKLSQKTHVSLSSFSESTAYLNVASVSSAKTLTGKDYLVFKPKDTTDDLDTEQIKSSIDSFLRRIELKHRDYEPIYPNFVLTIHDRMNVPNADYYKIYRDVVVYWDELNDDINQDKMSAKRDKSALMCLESTTDLFAIEKDSVTENESIIINLETQQMMMSPVNTEIIGSEKTKQTTTQYIPTSAYVVPMSGNKAVDINDYDTVDSISLSHSQAVDDFFNKGRVFTSDEEIDTSRLKSDSDLKDKILSGEQVMPTKKGTAIEDATGGN